MKIFQYTNKGSREENQDSLSTVPFPITQLFSSLQMAWVVIPMELLHQK